MPVAGIHFVGAPPRPATCCADRILLVNFVMIVGMMGPEFQRLLCHEEDRRVPSHQTTSSVVVVVPTTAIIRM